MSYISQAWTMAVKNSEKAEACFLCLISSYQAYGGPEEGGWWYTVNTLEEWKEFPSRQEAEKVLQELEKIAKELEHTAQQQYGEYCQSTMDFLEARGLEADFLPEPDGPTKYRVRICEELPEFNNRRPHYE